MSKCKKIITVEKTYTVPGRYLFKVPCGCYWLNVDATGGGGGGAVPVNGFPVSYGNGGGGAATTRVGFPVKPCKIVTITVGAGGLGGQATGSTAGANGETGQASTVTYQNIAVYAGGGQGGTATETISSTPGGTGSVTGIPTDTGAIFPGGEGSNGNAYDAGVGGGSTLGSGGFPGDFPTGTILPLNGLTGAGGAGGFRTTPTDTVAGANGGNGAVRLLWSQTRC